MKFNNWLDRVHGESRSVEYCCCGTPNVPKFTLSVKEKGYPILKQTGEHNLYEEIQSYKDSCDLSSILQQFDLGSIPGIPFDELGDLNDFTDMPMSPGELLGLVRRGEQMFDELPNEVRSKFNYSLYNFVGSFGSSDFIQKMEAAYGIEKTPPPVVNPDPMVDPVPVGDDNGDV